jgi:hypothetical protein
MEFSSEEIEAVVHVPEELSIIKAKMYPSSKVGNKIIKNKMRLYFRVGEGVVQQKDKSFSNTGCIRSDCFAAISDIVSLIQIGPIEPPVGPSENTSVISKDQSPELKRPQRKLKKALYISARSMHNHGGYRPGAGKKSRAFLKKNKKRLKTIATLQNYRKHRRLMEKRKKKQEEKIQIQNQVRDKYVDVLNCAIRSGDYSEVFGHNYSNTSDYQIGRLGTQSVAVLAFYKLLNADSGMKRKDGFIAAQQFVSFEIHWRTIQNWVIDFEENQGKFSECLQGKWKRRWILEEVDLKNKAIVFLRTQQKNLDINLTVELFQEFLNEDLLPNAQLNLKQMYGLEIPISKETARMWMLNLGFNYKAHAKDIYYDGHDRPDVVDYRACFLSRFLDSDHGTAVFSYLDRSKLFLHMPIDTAKSIFKFDHETIQKYLVHDICEFHIDDFDFDRDKLCQMNILPELSFKIVYDGKPLKIFYQDEVIFRSYEASKRFWHMEKDQGIRKKGDGVGVMLSGFVCEEDGFVSLTQEEYDLLKATIMPNPKYFVQYESKFFFLLSFI